MKITKQARAALFVMLFAISILPGCGKNKNQDTGIIGVGVSTVAVGYGTAVNGCTNLMGATGAVTLYFAGSAQWTAGSLNGFLQLSSAAVTGGQFIRYNSFGDQAVIGMSGNTAYAQVTLAPITVQAINSGGGLVCGFGIQSMTINGTYNGLPALAGCLMGPAGQDGRPSRSFNGYSYSNIYL